MIFRRPGGGRAPVKVEAVCREVWSARSFALRGTSRPVANPEAGARPRAAPRASSRGPVAHRGRAHQSLDGADGRDPRRGPALPDHPRGGLGRLLPRLASALVGDRGQCGRGEADPHHPRGRADHRGRRRLLDHPGRAHPHLHPVRPADAAQLHPGPRHAVDPRHLRRHLRLRDARPGRRGQRAQGRLRAARLDHRRARADADRRRGADLLHPPHRRDDPAAAGHRVDRGGSGRRDRERDGRARRARALAQRTRGGRAARAAGPRRRGGGLPGQRLPAVRPALDADRPRGPLRRGDQAAPPAGPLRRARPPLPHRLARDRRAGRGALAAPLAHQPARTAP